MPARMWFTRENTADLAPDDLAIINRAARNIWPPGETPPRRLDLMTLRAAYRRGMSADDLMDAVRHA